MKYLVMVSHGKLADGLHNALGMLVGKDRTDIRSTGLEDGMGADVYAENLRKLLADVKPEDQVVLLGDLIGGSPLTTAIGVISDMGLLPATVIIGGMNLPVALNAVLSKDDTPLEELVQTALAGAEVREFVVEQGGEDEDI